MRGDNQYFLAIRPTAASEWRVLVFTTARERAFFGDDYEETHRNGQAVRAGRNDLSRFMECRRKTGHLAVQDFAPFAMQFSDVTPIGEVGTCCCVGTCDRVFRQGMAVGNGCQYQQGQAYCNHCGGHSHRCEQSVDYRQGMEAGK